MSLSRTIMTQLEKACETFVTRRLFYPSSGGDVIQPVSTFLPFIDEFWFVDTNYDLTQPLLANKGLNLNFESSEWQRLSGTTIRANEPYEIEVQREAYRHESTDRKIIVNVCRGRGYDLFRTAFRIPNEMISVFFYRGDSPGESGSGFYWLRRPIIKFVLKQLEKNALLVSDGSNAISQLSAFHRNGSIGRHAVDESTPFTIYERRIEPIAYLGERYGPTLAWKIEATEQRDERES